MPPSRGLFDGSYSGRPPRFAILRSVLLIVVTTGLLAALFFGGEYVQRYLRYTEGRGATGQPVSPIDPIRTIVLNTIAEIPIPGRHEQLLESGLPVYDLRIDADDLRELQNLAELVTERGISTGLAREYKNAEFLLGGRWLPIQVKLRGLMSGHYIKKRPSLRLKFPKDRLYEGKRQINLSDPYDKGLAVDVTTNWESQRYGILTWDSRFVVLRVNGEVVGLFQEIEQFGRSMSDRNGRPEGFIFSGSGQFFGVEGSGFDKAVKAIEALQGCHPREGEPVADHCDWDFVREYFDTDRWAWAAALKAVLSSKHAWDHDNLRLFWDPAYGQFEPIPWDYSCFRIDPAIDPDGEHLTGTLGEVFVALPEFRRMRDRRLWTLIEERVDAMMNHADEIFSGLEHALAADTRHLGIALDRSRQKDYLQKLDSNRLYLKSLFQRQDLRATTWPAPGGERVVALDNHGKAFVSVAGAVWEHEGETITTPLVEPLIVDGIWQDEPGHAWLRVTVPEGASLVALTAQNEVTGTALDGDAIRLAAGTGPAPEVPSPIEPAPFALPIDGITSEDDRIVFGPGAVRIDGVVEIPESHDVVFQPGLQLRMGEGASLLVYGDFSSRGTPEAPIDVRGHENATWGAIAIHGSRSDPRRVRVAHTTIAGGTGAENDRVVFTGSFAVHGGIVEMTDSRFLSGRAIDGINLKYCEVELAGNYFEDSADDTVDCDFCTGRISGTRVVDSGGDGLDFSGSSIELSDNEVRRCADKGVSVGEATTATIRSMTISDCYAGIAVKDLSRATISNSTLRNLEVGIALYIKKPTFGPSQARLENVTMHDVATRVVKDDTCSLIE